MQIVESVCTMHDMLAVADRQLKTAHRGPNTRSILIISMPNYLALDFYCLMNAYFYY